MKRKLLILTLSTLYAISMTAASVTPRADIPAYYAGADGKAGSALWSAVSAITKKGYSSLGYDGLYAAYLKTDVYPADSVGKAGHIWDMYGECDFPSSKTCGNYSGVCSCYNREHSIPQSWWGGGTGGIGNDIFHVLPTDGKINGVRSNYEYGVVNGGTNWKGNKHGSAGSWSTDRKTIASTAGEVINGSGTVFEPMPQYKGDWARGILGTIIKWEQSKLTTGNNFFSGVYDAANYFGLKKRAVVLLMKWHREDPVSQKEIDRNNGIQQTQGNRNPFIDYPYLAEYIWGEHAGETVDFNDLMPSTDVDFIPGVSDGHRDSTNPRIVCPTTEIIFDVVLEGQSTQQTIQVQGLHLVDDITLSVSGDGATHFSVSPASMGLPAAETLQTYTVSYAPQAVGLHAAVLTISSTDATPITIDLLGECAEECTVQWKVNGVEYSAGDPTTSLAAGGRVSVLPTAPPSCSQLSEQFVGWTATAISGTTDDVPADLFSDASEAPQVNANTTYHAVFAHVSETEGGQGDNLVWTTSGAIGWTESGLKSTSDYKIILSGASITSPQINLARLSKISITMRTYGGNNRNTITVSAGEQSIATITTSSGTTFATKEWTPSTTLSGTAALVFTSPTSSNQYGPGVNNITIEMAGTAYTYSRFITSCSESPTALPDIQSASDAADKYLYEGNLFIRFNGNTYNVIGGRVE